ncbi:MAG: hypothetical protein HY718_14685, partial [Planctomycetes bacterium]|nr:hypothetical protein [Planctomycetota bacterium]
MIIAHETIKRCWTGILACLLLTGLAWGQVISGYEMTLSPDQEPDPLIKVGDGFGDAANGDFAWPLNPGGFPTGPAGLDGGIGHFLDTDEASATDPDHASAGFYKSGLGSIFTIDMRVKANWSVNGVAGRRRSMGIHNGMTTAGQGAAIRLSADPATPGSGFIRFFGTTSGNEVNLGQFNVALTDFHSVRIALNGTQVTVYDLDTACGPPWNVIGVVD